MSRARSAIIASAVSILASCAVGPYSGQQIYTSEVEFDGFVQNPGVQVRLEAFDYGPDKFVGLATVRAETTPTFRAGAICPNSPALYRYKGKIDLKWPIYWDWVGESGTPYHTKVRALEVTSGEIPLFFTANENPGQCMAANAFNNTCDFQNVAVTKCGFKLNQAVIKGTGYGPWNN